MAVDGASANDFVTRVRALLLVRGLAELRRRAEQALIARVELGRLEVEAARRRRDLVGEVAEGQGRRGRVGGFHLLGHCARCVSLRVARSRSDGSWLKERSSRSFAGTAVSPMSHARRRFHKIDAHRS